MNKLLTIAIPTYNRAELLDKQLTWLAGAIKGFESDCEIFVSDNCSTDNTQEVIQKWQKNFTNITFKTHRQSENIGLMNNLGFCINIAKTEYVWEIGDDDPIQDRAISYVISKLKQHQDLSLLLLNFSGRENTGQAVHPPTIPDNRWFDIVSEDARGDSKAIFGHCFETSIGAVMFLTAIVYRTEVVQRGYQLWKDGATNLLFLAYLTGYCAAHGSVIVTKDVYMECTVGVSHWQKDETALMLIQNKYIPDVLVKLEECGYPKHFCRRLILEHFQHSSWKIFFGALRRWPILSIKTIIPYLALVCISAWQMMSFPDLKIPELSNQNIQ